MTAPVRLRLSRAKGFNLQALSQATNGLEAVVVARPTQFGNPWTVRGAREAGYTGTDHGLAAWAVELFTEWVEERPRSLTAMLHNGDRMRARLHAGLPLLRGRNLACWCPLDQPCHADVLLRLANAPARELMKEGGA